MKEEIKKVVEDSKAIDELNKLKEEVIKSCETPKKEKKKLQWDSAVITAVLIILVAVSLSQALESKAILAKIESGNLKSNSAAPALPSTLEDLPDMVGGC